MHELKQAVPQLRHNSNLKAVKKQYMKAIKKAVKDALKMKYFFIEINYKMH